MESIQPEHVRDRITAPFPNADAALLQERLDKANDEIARLVKRMGSMNADFERSRELWKKRHREDTWLADLGLDGIGNRIDRRPEPDPPDW